MEVAAESALLNPSSFFTRSSTSFLPASRPQIRLPTKNVASNLLLFSNSHRLQRPVGSQRLVLFQIPTKSGFCLQIPTKWGSWRWRFDYEFEIRVFCKSENYCVGCYCYWGFSVWLPKSFCGGRSCGFGLWGYRTEHIVIEELLAETFSGSLGFKEQGLLLADLLGLSAFFPMAETSFTTL